MVHDRAEFPAVGLFIPSPSTRLVQAKSIAELLGDMRGLEPLADAAHAGDLLLAAQGKADAELASTPVVLLSAKAQAADVRAGLEAGADDYVTKPFEPLDLIARVEGVLGH